MSATCADRSRMRPSASTRPGFSAPGAPWRQSFMGLFSVRIGTVEGNVAVELDAEARPVEFAGADAAVHRQRLAEQLRCEHRHPLGRAGVHHQKFGARSEENKSEAQTL